MRVPLALVAATFLLTDCKHVGLRSGNQDLVEHDGSSLQFADSGWAVSGCTVRHVHAPAIKVCIKGNGNQQTAQQHIKTAVKQWTAPLAAQFQNVTSEVEFTCNAPHLTANISAGFIASMGGPGWIQTGDQNQIGTWLHEFGHAFACLGDTYVGGQAGHCQAGQPKSVMCYGLLLAALTEDDHKGVVFQYKKLNLGAAAQDPNGDEDSDTIANALDKCPGTPAGATIWKEQEGGKWRGCAMGQTPIML